MVISIYMNKNITRSAVGQQKKTQHHRLEPGRKCPIVCQNTSTTQSVLYHSLWYGRTEQQKTIQQHRLAIGKQCPIVCQSRTHNTDHSKT